MTSEILAEIHARSAEEPGAELFCRRTSSGLTARCIEGPGDMSTVLPCACVCGDGRCACRSAHVLPSAPFAHLCGGFFPVAV